MVNFSIQLDTVVTHDDDQFLWFHPRAAAIPGMGADGAPRVVMTLQKHLRVSDHYSGLYTMQTDDLGATWSPPEERPELAWVDENDVHISVCDVTPGWHAPSGKLIAIGAQVRYSPEGDQLEDIYRAAQTAYTVHDPETGTWTPWRVIELPDDTQFDYARNACAQWLVQPDGTLLLPFYHGATATVPHHVSVIQFSFDGDELRCMRRGSEHILDVERGLCEPSIAYFEGRYFLTIRNDVKGYVTVSDDGLGYGPIRPWAFQDGEELGSYNTQQHWLAHSEGLCLTYTRRGANNDHIMRNRAPLFIAQVDPDSLHVIRETERVLVPERGAALGNFGAAPISAGESWVTVSEGIWSDDARNRGAMGATFVSRVKWE
ncbi:MAG TPA: sialidase family protein, partial [Armatimonadota bacterium]|nr:sialidase family protein [Armatimonadota bacterium]